MTTTLPEIITRYEKFIANIEWHIETNKPTGADLEICQKDISRYSDFLQELKSISTHLVAVPDEKGWINVDDEKPADFKIVYVGWSVEQKVLTGYWNRNKNHFVDEFSDKRIHPSHWMNIYKPKPPKL